MLAYIGNQMVALGGRAGFQVTASDPDETIPVLGAEGLPDGATFEDQGDGTGIFFWQTVTEDYGVHSVRFVASDGEAVRRWALAGHGIAYKSRLDVAQDLAAGRLVQLCPDAVGEGAPLHLMCPDRRQITRTTHRLHAFLAARCALAPYAA